MLVELKRADFVTARELFRPFEFQPMCDAVLEGRHPGRVFVDSSEFPRTAFLSVFHRSTYEGLWGFLAGESGNDAFNRALNMSILNREIAGEHLPILFVTCCPDDWDRALLVVFAPREPVPVIRRHYVCSALTYPWRERIPQGYTVHRIDESLLTRRGLQVPEEVKISLVKWGPGAGPMPRPGGFGFVVIHEGPGTGSPEVAAWAIVEFVAGSGAEAGAGTRDPSGRPGPALAAVAAAIEHGFSQGLSYLSWTCPDDDSASVQLAEALGFERLSDTRTFLLGFEEASIAALRAYDALYERRYQQAADLYAKLFQLRSDPPAWARVDAARAWAGLGNRARALENLGAAAAGGWRDSSEIERCVEFRDLHPLPEWMALLETMRRNR